MTKEELAAKVERAAELGARAHREGKRAVPALDQDLLALLQGNEIGVGLPVLEAWTRAWHAANAAAPASVETRPSG